MLAAGHHYGHLFGGAVFGPAGSAVTVIGSTLFGAGETGTRPLQPLTDPGYAADPGSLPVARSRAWLYEGSPRLARRRRRR